MLERNEESTLEEDPTLSHDEQVNEENQKADDAYLSSIEDAIYDNDMVKASSIMANKISEDLMEMYKS